MKHIAAYKNNTTSLNRRVTHRDVPAIINVLVMRAEQALHRDYITCIITHAYIKRA